MEGDTVTFTSSCSGFSFSAEPGLPSSEVLRGRGFSRALPTTIPPPTVLVVVRVVSVVVPVVFTAWVVVLLLVEWVAARETVAM